MKSIPDQSRFQALMSRLCDGDINARELSELSARLENNQKAISEYVAYTTLHLHLGHKLRRVRSADMIEADVAGNLKEDANIAKIATQRTASNRQFARPAAIVAVAASLLLAAAFLIPSDPAQPEFTARILQKIDCDWGEERWGSPQSALLEVDREIKLDRGLMVLEFGNGAEVTLEAPVQFRILAKDRGDLGFGKLTALIPKRGQGFTVEIPAGEVVDLGTSFGVLVDEDGDSETHVFQGSVLLRSDVAVEGQSQQQWRLAADDALRLSAANGVQRLVARPASFVHASRYVNPPTAVTDRPSLNITGGSELAVWLDAAKRLQLDENGRIISWGDLAYGNNNSEDSAWQVDAEKRPRWIATARGGRPAVRFDGASFLMTTPFLSNEDVTVICVFRGLPREFPNRRTAQLVNFNGPPSLMLEQTRDNQLIGAVVSGRPGERHAYGGLLEISLPAEGEPVVCAYVYSSSQNRSSLYLNSRLIAESKAPQHSAVRSPKYIGRSNEADAYFVGDIYELLLFNSKLTPEQCESISSELMEEFGIAVEMEREPRVLSGLVPEEE